MTGHKLKLPVYLDYQATTPVDERVLAAMLPWFSERYGNPHSAAHALGWEAAGAVTGAADRVAALIGAEGRDIVFTSGATESNNLALKGVMRACRGRRDHLITVASEHKCVIESARALAGEGFRVDFLTVDGAGLIDPDQLAATLDDDTALVSVMAVNNETGVIQPLARIGALCRDRGVFFHCDAAQAAGKIMLDVEALNIDLMSLSAHKIYGPKGVGALFLRRRRPRVPIEPLFSGGGQQGGVRPGTMAPALCVGMGEAAALAGTEMADEVARIGALGHRLWDGIHAGLRTARLNGDATARFWGNVNIAFPGVDAGRLMAELGDLAVSSGAACASAVSGPSYVLEAMGVSRADASASIRFGVGRFTTRAEIDFAIGRIVDTVGKLSSAAA